MQKIFLTLLNGTGYVFDVDDYIELRTEHRIIACFVGNMASPGGIGLPAELTPFETRLLVEEGIAQLVSKADSLLRAPTSEEASAYETEAELRLVAQADALKAQRLRDAEHNIQKILAGKRRKLEQAGQPTDELTSEVVLQEIGDQYVFEKKNAFVQIPCAHAEEHEARIVQLPELSARDALKYRVFKDYWKKGKYVTPGDAFGGDFLIYPGDPIGYHASHVIIVIDRPTALDILEIVTKIRLTVMVKKIFVIAYTKEDPTDDDVLYQTIEWDGRDDARNSDISSLEQHDNSSNDVNITSTISDM